MKSFLSISKNNTISSICIGKFDGVHLAHQSIFASMPKEDSLVLLILREKERFALTPNPQELISLPVYFLELEKIKDMGDKEFADFLLHFLPHLKSIVVGYDFLFGKNRSYTPRDLKKFFEVIIVPEVSLEGEAIHTQNIIEYLKNGKIERANAMLGRAYAISGEVIKGQGIGAKELVPTLNLVSKGYILPQSGVYATISEIEGVRYKSVSFLGHRFSTDGEFAIESHLLDTHLSQSPKNLKIYFYQKIRENQKFASLFELREQINQDILQAQKILDS
ncbi:bifunctional riboflavin kinase/FAD synthetase [Helicobacter brantae]|uniref:Riboflavin biosynthesis protein n=1 Tax=Helicobacter brantae TaxID=375927 RepID=A0A3D8J2C4_9HELI|nr:bifunctional riboflavin kinase/FAD synthetase [Helicobacter brantae]RDU70911.1 bifunctional riboflavin kinase/FAD synthetase [Helicobacter brantae]